MTTPLLTLGNDHHPDSPMWDNEMLREDLAAHPAVQNLDGEQFEALWAWVNRIPGQIGTLELADQLRELEGVTIYLDNVRAWLHRLVEQRPVERCHAVMHGPSTHTTYVCALLAEHAGEGHITPHGERFPADS